MYSPQVLSLPLVANSGLGLIVVSAGNTATATSHAYSTINPLSGLASSGSPTFVALPTGTASTGFPQALTGTATASDVSGVAGRAAVYVVGGLNLTSSLLTNAVRRSVDGVTFQVLSQPTYAIFSPRTQASLVALFSGVSSTAPSALVLTGGFVGTSNTLPTNDVWTRSAATTLLPFLHPPILHPTLSPPLSLRVRF